MKLSICARGRAMVTDPTRPVMKGTMPSYVGRVYDETARSFKPTSEPQAFEVDTLSNRVALRLAKIIRQGDLWPHDAETAEFLCVPFVAVEFTSGHWLPIPVPAKQEEDSTTTADSTDIANHVFGPSVDASTLLGQPTRPEPVSPPAREAGKKGNR